MKRSGCVLVALALAACGAEEEKTPVDPGALGGLAYDAGKADGAGAFRGALALDVPVQGQLSARSPAQVWRLALPAGGDVRVDLTGRRREDTYLAVFREAGGDRALVAANDDCADGIGSCLDLAGLEAGNYVVLATTWRYAALHRPAAARYDLVVHCAGGGCAEVACGSRGLPECPDGQYCDFADSACGAADAPGVCRRRPELCPDVYRPVCGCDGHTYGNACDAAAAGVDAARDGACGRGEGETCGGIANLQCGPGLRCDYSANVGCGIADMGGVCVPDAPVVCPLLFRPECGCDGVTYSNACERRGAGVALDHTGECAAPAVCGGIAGLRCDDGFTCDYSGNVGCGIADAAGVCVPDAPVACPADADPVCGCDGMTYANDCLRHAAHVPLDHAGACR